MNKITFIFSLILMVSCSSNVKNNNVERTVAGSGSFGAPVKEGALQNAENAQYRFLFEDIVAIANGNLDPCSLKTISIVSKGQKATLILKMSKINNSPNQFLSKFSQSIDAPEVNVEQIELYLTETEKCIVTR